MRWFTIQKILPHSKIGLLQPVYLPHAQDHGTNETSPLALPFHFAIMHFFKMLKKVEIILVLQPCHIIMFFSTPYPFYSVTIASSQTRGVSMHVASLRRYDIFRGQLAAVACLEQLICFEHFSTRGSEGGSKAILKLASSNSCFKERTLVWRSHRDQ
jgi:hypothetical protein